MNHVIIRQPTHHNPYCVAAFAILVWQLSNLAMDVAYRLLNGGLQP